VNAFLACALAVSLAMQAARSEPAKPLEIESQGGHFKARLGKAAGQERVADAIARWRLEVTDADGRSQWSAVYPAPQASQRFLLSEDGAYFVALAQAWSDSRPIVSIRSGSDEPTPIYGGELDIARDALRTAEPPGAWLAAGDDSARFTWIAGPSGPRQMLELACVDGVRRSIDLESGAATDAGGGQVKVTVEPPFDSDHDSVPPSRPAPVTSFTAPARCAGDEPLVVHIEGSHPQPGWKVFAFGMQAAGEDGRTLVLSPRAKPPMPGGVSVQQVDPYVAEARILGLPPGRYRIAVEGAQGPAATPVEVEITPGGVLAELTTRGGILGLDERVTLFENGVVEVRSNRPERHSMAFNAPRPFAEARALLSRLPAIAPTVASPGADLFKYALRWRAPEGWREVQADDGNARGELRAAIDAVRALTQP
jgi:hypothetical protein